MTTRRTQRNVGGAAVDYGNMDVVKEARSTATNKGKKHRKSGGRAELKSGGVAASGRMDRATGGRLARATGGGCEHNPFSSAGSFDRSGPHSK